MAIEKIVNILIKDNAVSASSNVDKLSSSLDSVSKSSSSVGDSFKNAGGDIIKNTEAIKQLDSVTSGLGSTLLDNALSVNLFSTASKVATGVQAFYTTVIGVSTGALKAFKVALATTGIGLVVVALGYFISKMSDAKSATEEQTRAQENLNIAIEKTSDILKNETDLLDSFTSAQKLRAEIAGKSAKDILKIEQDASDQRIVLIRKQKAELLLLQNDKDLSPAAAAEINKKLLKNNNDFIAELNKQEINKLEFDKDIADQERDAAIKKKEKKSKQKDIDLADKLKAEEEHAKELKKIGEEIAAFALADRKKEREDFEKLIQEKDAILNKLKPKNALEDLSAEYEKNRLILEATQATSDELLALGVDYEAKRQLLLSQSEGSDINKQNNIINNEALSFQTRFDALAAQRQLILDADIDDETLRTSMLEENSKARGELREAEFKFTAAIAGKVGDIAENAANLAGKHTAIGKTLAVAGAVMKTYESAVNAYNSLSSVPIVGPALGAVAAGLAVATGIANVKKILAVKIPNAPSSGGGGDLSAAAVPAAPSFNVVGQSSTNQLADSIAKQQNKPVQAYVVSGEMTSQQQLDRNRERTATFNG